MRSTHGSRKAASHEVMASHVSSLELNGLESFSKPLRPRLKDLNVGARTSANLSK